MQDGVTHFGWKLFSFGLIPPKGEDPVTKNGQIDEHPDVLHGKKMTSPPQIPVYQI
jgi:hypothetical protein